MEAQKRQALSSLLGGVSEHPRMYAQMLYIVKARQLLTSLLPKYEQVKQRHSHALETLKDCDRTSEKELEVQENKVGAEFKKLFAEYSESIAEYGKAFDERNLGALSLAQYSKSPGDVNSGVVAANYIKQFMHCLASTVNQMDREIEEYIHLNELVGAFKEVVDTIGSDQLEVTDEDRDHLDTIIKHSVGNDESVETHVEALLIIADIVRALESVYVQKPELRQLGFSTPMLDNTVVSSASSRQSPADSGYDGEDVGHLSDIEDDGPHR